MWIPTPGPRGNAPRARSAPTWPLQNILLVVGALLLVGASIVFLMFTWGQMELATRAIVVAAITCAVIALAWFVQRRGLQSSAEAIAALGTALVLLDAWAVWATGLVDGINLWAYLAAAAVVSGGLLIGAARLTRIYTFEAVGLVVVVAAPALLAVAVGNVQISGALFVCSAILCLVRFTPLPAKALHGLLEGLAVAYLAVPLLRACFAVSPSGSAWRIPSILLVTLVCGAWAWFGGPRPSVQPPRAPTDLTWRPTMRGSAVAWAAACGVTTALAAVLLVWTATQSWSMQTATLILSIGPAVAIAALSWLRPFAPYLVRPAVVGALMVWLGGVLVTGAVIGQEVAAVIPNLGQSDTHNGALDPVFLLALALLVLVGLAVKRLTRNDQLLVLSGRVVAYAGGFVLMLSLPLPIHDGRLVVVAWLVLGCAAAVVRMPGADIWFRSLARAVAVTAILGAVQVAVQITSGHFANRSILESLLLAAAFGSLGFLIWIALSWFAPTPSWDVQVTLRAAALGSIAFGLGLAASGGSAPNATLWWVPAAVLVLGSLYGEAFRLLGKPATRTVHDTTRHALLTVTLAAVGCAISAQIARSGWLHAVPGPSAAEVDWAAAATCLVATALAVLVTASRSASLRFGLRLLYAACAPVLTVLTVLSLRPLVSATPAVWANLVLVVLAALIALGWVLGHPEPQIRLTGELVSAVLASTALILVAVTSAADQVVVSLLVAAAGMTVVAVLPGRSELWRAPVLLALIAVWVGLGHASVTLPEAYTLPLAGTLLSVAAVFVVLARRRRARIPGAPVALTPEINALLRAGVLILVLPTALLAPLRAPLWRPIATLIASLLLSLLVLLVTRAARGRQPVRLPDQGSPTGVLLGVCAWSALATAAIGIVGRGVVSAGILNSSKNSAQGLPPDRTFLLWPVDLGQIWGWALCGACLVTVAAFALRTLPGRTNIAQWAPTAVLAAATAPFLILLWAGTLNNPSAILPIMLLWAASTVAVALLAPPAAYSPPIWSGPLVGTYLVTVFSLKSWENFDFLLIAGCAVTVIALRTRRAVPTQSSWRTVGWAAAATLVPATTAMIITPGPVRAAVALILATIWFVAGLRARWQAGVGSGAAALLIQVGFLAGPPALAASAGLPGWAILAVVGTLLLGTGLTYEKQLKALKTTVLRFHELG